ncbi:secretogranin-1 [Ochotona princeps]|uniref:secretogranin-1 n=1 Tax=Ochotona princeps TaxID=9978 RepID=UPI002715267B|nr:secretogranin-1 [Ochotona princeps]
MLRARLLSLLGAAVLAAVSAMPLDNRNHNEEMVTRCIIEVLSSALSKSNAPPVTPECRQVLKNSGKEAKDEEKSGKENSKFEVRLLRDPGAASEGQRASSRAEEDAWGPTKVENRAPGGGRGQEGTVAPGSSTRAAKEAQTRPSEKTVGTDSEEEEGENNSKERHGEDATDGKHRTELGETQKALPDKRSQAAAQAVRWDGHSEEETHSREKSSRESGEEMGSREERPPEPTSQSQSQEESEESREDATVEVAKRRARPRHHHGRSRPDRAQDGTLGSQEGGQSHPEMEAAGAGTAGAGGRAVQHAAHPRASEEEPAYGAEGRSSAGVRAPAYRDRGSEEYRALGPQSVESREEGEEPSLELDNMAHRDGEGREVERGREQGKGPRSRGQGGEPAARSSLTTRGEQGPMGEGHRRIQESQMDKASRLLPGEWSAPERRYLSYGDEGAQGKWPWQEDLQAPEEVMLQDRFGPYPSKERRKRLGGLFNPYFDPLQWKDGRFEKKDSLDDNFLEGEEENGMALNERAFFPEYSYDWWERKPFSEDVNWGYEKRSSARAPKLNLKRQYDRVAELDRLLHYRKKAAEFPDFYDSEEQMSPRHEAERERAGEDEAVLTDQEEKELENLAAMDLELQKIAEKFSQRG